jgi:hypothetical protein
MCVQNAFGRQAILVDEHEDSFRFKAAGKPRVNNDCLFRLFTDYDIAIRA